MENVRVGHRSSSIFEHTITDILRVLEFKLANSRNSQNDGPNFALLPDYSKFRQLDSDSEEEGEGDNKGNADELGGGSQ